MQNKRRCGSYGLQQPEFREGGVMENIKELIEQKAKQELEQEKFRQAVDACKEKLKRPWHVKIFPWRISVKINFRRL